MRRVLICLILAAPTSVVAGQSIADLTPYTPVTVSGIVDRVTDEDTFILRDHTGRIPVYLGPNRVPVVAGTAVTVSGFLDDDWPREIYADGLTTGDGQSFTFERRSD